MSRKWERMVERNTKKINTQRTKQGKTPITGDSGDGYERYWGRRWIFPAFLVAFSIMFGAMFYGIYKGGSYYFVVVSYFALGLLAFFTRRPFIGFGRGKLMTRRFNGDKTADANEIEQIILQKGYVIIQFKEKKQRWVFSKIYQLMDIPAIQDKMRLFARQHQIPLSDDAMAAEGSLKK